MFQLLSCLITDELIDKATSGNWCTYICDPNVSQKWIQPKSEITQSASTPISILPNPSSIHHACINLTSELSSITNNGIDSIQQFTFDIIWILPTISQFLKLSNEDKFCLESWKCEIYASLTRAIKYHNACFHIVRTAMDQQQDLSVQSQYLEYFDGQYWMEVLQHSSTAYSNLWNLKPTSVSDIYHKEIIIKAILDILQPSSCATVTLALPVYKPSVGQIEKNSDEEEKKDSMDANGTNVSKVMFEFALCPPVSPEIKGDTDTDNNTHNRISNIFGWTSMNLIETVHKSSITGCLLGTNNSNDFGNYFILKPIDDTADILYETWRDKFRCSSSKEYVAWIVQFSDKKQCQRRVQNIADFLDLYGKIANFSEDDYLLYYGLKHSQTHFMEYTHLAKCLGKDFSEICKQDPTDCKLVKPVQNQSNQISPKYLVYPIILEDIGEDLMKMISNKSNFKDSQWVLIAHRMI